MSVASVRFRGNWNHVNLCPSIVPQVQKRAIAEDDHIQHGKRMSKYTLLAIHGASGHLRLLFSCGADGGEMRGVAYQLARAGNVPSGDHLAALPIADWMQEEPLQQRIGKELVEWSCV